MKACSIQLTHHPGDFARAAQALARRRVNIKGAHGPQHRRPGDAGMNLEALYTAGITHDLVQIAFFCDNPKMAKKLLEEF